MGNKGYENALWQQTTKEASHGKQWKPTFMLFRLNKNVYKKIWKEKNPTVGVGSQRLKFWLHT